MVYAYIYYYSCNDAKKKICNRRNVPKHYIENLVIEKCKELLTKQNIEIIVNEVYNVCKKVSNESTLLRCLEKQLKETNSSIKSLMKAFEKGENIDLINSRLNVISHNQFYCAFKFFLLVLESIYQYYFC